MGPSAVVDELNYPYYRDEKHGGHIKLENPGHPPARWMSGLSSNAAHEAERASA